METEESFLGHPDLVNKNEDEDTLKFLKSNKNVYESFCSSLCTSNQKNSLNNSSLNLYFGIAYQSKLNSSNLDDVCN